MTEEGIKDTLLPVVLKRIAEVMGPTWMNFPTTPIPVIIWTPDGAFGVGQVKVVHLTLDVLNHSAFDTQPVILLELGESVVHRVEGG